MAEHVYEGMYIVDTGRYGRGPDAVADQIQKTITQAGGEILVSRLWEERRLAFAIKGHRKGVYWLTYFRLEADKLAGVQRQFRLIDAILRALFVKVDPRIVDALVDHAKAEEAASSEKKTAADAAPADSEADAGADAKVDGEQGSTVAAEVDGEQGSTAAAVDDKTD